MSSGDPETRTRILKKTWQLLERRPGRELRLEDVARAAGVSRQAVYLHFGSRTGLLTATVRFIDEAKGAEERLRGLRAASDGEAILEALIDFWGGYMPEIEGAAKALLAVRESDKAAAAAWDDRMEALQQCCRAVGRCLAREGRLASEWTPEQAADILWGMISIQVWEKLRRECGWTNEEYVSRMKAATKRVLMK